MMRFGLHTQDRLSGIRNSGSWERLLDLRRHSPRSRRVVMLVSRRPAKGPSRGCGSDQVAPMAKLALFYRKGVRVNKPYWCFPQECMLTASRTFDFNVYGALAEPATIPDDAVRGVPVAVVACRPYLRRAGHACTRSAILALGTESPWVRLRARRKLVGTESPWARLRARWKLVRTESPWEPVGTESLLELVGSEGPLEPFKSESPLEPVEACLPKAREVMSWYPIRAALLSIASVSQGRWVRSSS
ncbi:hypothetical protein BHE74_00043574 [Ensete ventricosum]|nr:hypothetical protein BHE74_00043574 [Ensete ventricosum]